MNSDFANSEGNRFQYFALTATYKNDYRDEQNYPLSGHYFELLVEKYGVKVLLMGYDHRFGSDRSTSFDEYVEYGNQLGLEVKRCSGFSASEVMVSSSKVRRALELWDIPLANKLLGYKYFLTHSSHPLVYISFWVCLSLSYACLYENQRYDTPFVCLFYSGL